MHIEPSGQACGALIHGLDLKRDLDAALAARIRAVWLEHQVIAITGQSLEVADLERFALAFGRYGEDPYLRAIAGHPRVVQVRRDANERTPIFAESWHSDWSFMASPPAATVLYGNVIPPVGGDTLFANQYAAFDALPAPLQARLRTLDGVHSARRGYARDGLYGERDVGRSMSIIHDDSALATRTHRLARVHPETGRTALFLSPAYTIGIANLPEDEAQDLLMTLYAHQVEERFQYRHRWQPGMLLMWDNRCVLHRATGGYDGHARLLHRITVYGD
jgi:taurine dioxygenase